MTTSRRRFKALTYTSMTLTAVLLVIGIAMTVYAFTGLDRRSAAFNATVGWAQAALITAVVIGVGAILVRRSLARRRPPSENAQA